MFGGAGQSDLTREDPRKGTKEPRRNAERGQPLEAFDKVGNSNQKEDEYYRGTGKAIRVAVSEQQETTSQEDWLSSQIIKKMSEMNERLEEQRRGTESLKQLIGVNQGRRLVHPGQLVEDQSATITILALTRGLNSRNGASQSLPIPAAGVMEKNIGPGVVQ